MTKAKGYFGFSGWGSGAGFCCAGAGFDWVVFADPRTELGPRRREAYTESVIEVSIKMTADHVVAFDRRLAVPRGPKAVWLPIPPKAAAISALVPLCSNTTITINRQTAMWIRVISAIMPVLLQPFCTGDHGAEGGI